MGKISGDLSGGEFLAELSSKDPRFGQLISNIITGINTLARNTGSSPTGDVSPPKAPNSVSVKVSGEMAHISINHSGELQRGVRYFSEISTDPQFGQPIVIDHGTSRTSHPIPLPTYPDGGGAKTKYYIRSYAQNPGGPPSEVTHGGSFEMGGTTHMTPLASTGSGTAPNNGQSAGQGLGINQMRQK